MEPLRSTNGVSAMLDGRRGRLIGNAVSPTLVECLGRRIMAVQVKYSRIRLNTGVSQELLDSSRQIIEPAVRLISPVKRNANEPSSQHEVLRNYNASNWLPRVRVTGLLASVGTGKRPVLHLDRTVSSESHRQA